MLQWGQRLSALDTRGRIRALDKAYWLQWGQRLSALDTEQQPNTDNAEQQLQWGQRLSALDTAFSPRFSLIIPLFGGECRYFARGSFFWLPN